MFLLTLPFKLCPANTVEVLYAKISNKVVIIIIIYYSNIDRLLKIQLCIQFIEKRLYLLLKVFEI